MSNHFSTPAASILTFLADPRFEVGVDFFAVVDLDLAATAFFGSTAFFGAGLALAFGAALVLEVEVLVVLALAALGAAVLLDKVDFFGATAVFGLSAVLLDGGAGLF